MIGIEAEFEHMVASGSAEVVVIATNIEPPVRSHAPKPATAGQVLKDTIIERTHQTMTAQALLGQTYLSHGALWAGLDERRQVLNRHLPTRALAYQAPLAAYPQAIHSGLFYRTEAFHPPLSHFAIRGYND